jgi:hypothetical protein
MSETFDFVIVGADWPERSSQRGCRGNSRGVMWATDARGATAPGDDVATGHSTWIARVYCAVIEMIDALFQLQG